MSTESLRDRLSHFIQTEGLLRHGDSLLLAVSGGVDSMVMLHLFTSLSPAWGFRLHVVHINHGLRSRESDEDEAFVRSTAEALHIPFFCRTVDTVGFAARQHLGKQEAARRLRYEYFSELSRSLHAKVLTAHHANDNAETVFMNALRGAGVRGLSGIPLRRDFIVRPLLFAYKNELEAYAVEHGVAFRTDSSNEKLEYRRNVLRSILLPRLEESGFPDAVRSLNRLARSMRSLAAHLQEEVQKILPDVSPEEPFALHALDVNRLGTVPTELRDEVILAILRKLQIEPTYDRVTRIEELCSQPTGKRFDVGRGIVAYRDRGRVLFYRPTDHQPFELPVQPDATYSLHDFHFEIHPAPNVPDRFPSEPEHAYIDADRLGRKLILRTWRPGDWFFPLGMNAKKKLSDFFTERKLSPIQKSMTPLLESDGAIVWVCGQRIDDRFKITSHTRSALELTYYPRHARLAH